MIVALIDREMHKDEIIRIIDRDLQQGFLNEYFSKTWCSTTSKYIYSGYAIADKILDDDNVIDIEALGREVFVAVARELETRQERRLEESDVQRIWW